MMPKIAGMKIGKSTTKSLPTPAGWPGIAPPIQVDIAFTAAGQADSAYRTGRDGIGAEAGEVEPGLDVGSMTFYICSHVDRDPWRSL